MKIIKFLSIFFMLNAFSAFSNNVQVSNVRLTGQDTANDFTMVEFDISWENSWRYDGGPSNWDAAWVFVKYKVGSGGTWQQAWLNNTGHQACNNVSVTSGLQNPELPFNSSTNPVLGAFVYHAIPGAGTFVCQDIQLRWNYGANSVMDDAQVDVKIFAIEMVYVPSGSFYVGSGGTESGAFYTYPTATTPYNITSEQVIPVGTSNGNLYYPNTSLFSGDQSGPIPAAYPKGHVAFYAMKYEITQQGYVDFLNTLTRQQQSSRVASNISGTVVSNRFVLANTNVPGVRNGVCCQSVVAAAPAPVEFSCDLNNNGSNNEVNDGICIVCGYLTYGDVSAYLDWACLRLMTEFEFEKCGRGIQLTIANEYPWGNYTVTVMSGIISGGTPTEILIPDNCNLNLGGVPVRAGVFAKGATDRTRSGAGYYGIMELGGNLWERGISVGNPAGRQYTGQHGNGVLTTLGDNDVLNWPSNGAVGVFARGGGYNDDFPFVRISDRYAAANSFSARDESFGGRGVRKAE